MKAASNSRFLKPGDNHPYAPESLEDTASHYGITKSRLLQWVDEGLPLLNNNTIDSFNACNWITWNRLNDAPALARRWKSYLAWFQPFISNQERSRTYRCTRTHTLYLPAQTHSTIKWALPTPMNNTHQHLEHCDLFRGVDSNTCDHTTYQEVSSTTPRKSYTVESNCTVHVNAFIKTAPTIKTKLRELLEPFLHEFIYGYRHHQHDDGGIPEKRMDGSCLDCALTAQSILEEHGWASTLCGGIIASTALANPHFWLEVTDGSKTTYVDPSLPCIARMLGAETEPWMSAYIGGVDARRVWLSKGPSQFACTPHSQFISAATGTAEVDGINAWHCIDWVCGECSWQFNSTQ